MAKPRYIDADGKQVVVKLMDDSWIFNMCVSADPIKPRHGVVWAHHDHCGRLPVPGDELPSFMLKMMESYGNCAAMAWHNDTLLGHIVFLPKAVARQRKATGWEYFGDTEKDKETLVVINLAMCSLSGHKFRRKGIGKALTGIMTEWAKENMWKRIEVYHTAGGLFPVDWLDHCIPPKPFWEKRGFKLTGKRGDGKFSDSCLQAVMEDNPRNNADEQKFKTEIIKEIHNNSIDQALYAYQFDLRLKL